MTRLVPFICNSGYAAAVEDVWGHLSPPSQDSAATEHQDSEQETVSSQVPFTDPDLPELLASVR